ncbi:calcitonin gene-related peptide 1 isoform X2 [Equus asinus]|uniref:Calcitonin peptide-like domain-containing protein n=1 Tax=Equus asinus TaxID=9793 RepID=A0A8C4LAR2_EQUAS|nr:calcitonin gene-related peptide 1 isoform X2 [Equus asinus]XP_046540904.1 calcitonin gene-related peptide 1 isoform X2 [Equus quagga]
MGFWKFSPFLPLSILVLYQVGIIQAAPFRSALESLPDPAVLPEEESRLLLAALVKDYVRMKVRALEQETEGASITAQKRSCNTASCLTHRLAGLLSSAGSMANSNLLPTEMGFKVSGRRRRDLQA